MTNSYVFSSKIWLYNGVGPWHFVTVNKSLAEEIKANLIFKPRGFGSVPVTVTSGNSSWKTSIFPDKNSTYLLPIKKSIRDTEKMDTIKPVKFKITVLI